ncbi:hypothetical protein TA3x_002568 [Tundrisphaera sp. TA3]|uniref:hypothetical protein n=1 Tax=Tundrisphaera sp. TA3 TaxID=3435775 RepID=UPI003EBD9AB2
MMVGYLATSPSLGQEHKMAPSSEAPLIHPDLVARYEKNAADIKALQETVQDGSRPEEDRLKAFHLLRRKYPDAAVVTSAALVKAKEPSEKVAAFAVGELGAAAAMSDHRMREGVQPTPTDLYMMRRHEFAREALRIGQKDPRPSIRNSATNTLAALSDKIGLDNVVAGANEGRYSALEAVNHLGLARRDVGAEFLEPYLDSSKSADVQAAAVTYLAGVPDLSNRIRDEFLLNPDAPMEARLAAARRLAKNPDIALLILSNDKTPPELFQETFTTYLTAEEKHFSEPQLKLIEGTLMRYKNANPDANLKRADDTVKKVREANSR